MRTISAAFPQYVEHISRWYVALPMDFVSQFCCCKEFSVSNTSFVTGAFSVRGGEAMRGLSCLVGCYVDIWIMRALANRSLGRQALKNDHDFPTNGEADMCTNINPAWPNGFCTIHLRLSLY